MKHHLPLLLAAFILTAAPLPAAEDTDELLNRLGDDSFAVRETAMNDLVALGEAALPALRRALSSTDPEIQWRAGTAIAMITHAVSAELRSQIGDAFATLRPRAWFERERLAMDIAAVGGRAAVPALARVLSSDTSEAVRRAAAIGLLRLGPEGLLALERCGAQFTGIPPDNAALRIEIGNGFLEEGKCERALAEYRRALLVDPENEIAWYNIACALSRLQRTEEALDALRKAIRFGYKDVEWMKRDTDLEHIRDTPGFSELVRELEQKAQPAER